MKMGPCAAHDIESSEASLHGPSRASIWFVERFIALRGHRPQTPDLEP